MNLFEIASREGYRFDSVKGALTVEDLWALPLTTRANGASLDSVAKQINSQLKTSVEESFVTQKTNADTTLTNKLELVKYIISVRMEEANVAKVRADKAQEKAKILEILARKQEQSLENSSEEDLLAKLAELG